MMDPFPPTEEQLAVIDDRGSNLLVLAGPGTGKTETLARRFASLVHDGIAPSRILVLTFSRRASEEMRDRVLLRLRQVRKTGLAVSELYVKTFHSFCARLLDGDDARLRKRSLMTPVKERLLWRKLMRSGRLSFASFDPQVAESAQFAADCLNVIGQLKGRGVDARRFSQIAAGDPRLGDIARVFEGMEAERARLGLRDYRDLVNEAEVELRDIESEAAVWLRKAGFAHILVDEFQDSDPMQLQLLEAMRTVLNPFFCFVGDKNQSIYRFRGASPGNVDEAGERFACKVLMLHDNRRSSPAVLEVANADMLLDEKSKTEAAYPDKAGRVRFVRPRTLEDEVRVVRDAVAEKVGAGVPPRSMAVLLRQTRPYQELIIDALTEAGIPVAVQATAGFHEDALIDAALSALRLLSAPRDAALWQRFLTNPIIGYRPIGVRSAFDAARRAGISDPQAILRTNGPQGVRPIDDFLDAWHRCQLAYERSSPVDLVETIVRELDLLRPVRESAPVEGFDLSSSPARLRALLHAAEDYGGDASGHGSSVEEFVEHLDETLGLLADATQPPASTVEGVRVISIHAAKGLEFDFVAIPQLIDGVLPASARPNRLLPARSLGTLRRNGVDIFVDDDEARSEEHSLWYVALTRARTEALATAAVIDDDGVEHLASPFAKTIEDSAADQSTNANGAIFQGAICQSPPTDPSRMPIRLPIETLSPTSITNFLACPRRFYYGDVLRLPKHDDQATQYGSNLHVILRKFHEIETNFENIGDPLAAAERFEQVLGRIIAETGGFGDTGLGPLARFERDDLELRLGQYARHLAEEAAANPFSVLACETDISSSFDGLTIRGKVDRVDRLANGDLVIRDYKSGRLRGRLALTLHNAFEQLDAGERLFGDAPDGLNLQTVLYVPGVEEAFGGRVRRLDYIYFRGKSVKDNRLLVDSTTILDSEEPSTDTGTLSRGDIARARRDIAAGIVTWCGSGTCIAFPTTDDDQVCRLCDFARVCPGSGTIPA